MKQEKILSLFNFEVGENYITSQGKLYYFIRLKPPNVSIMDDRDFEMEIANFTALLDTLNCPFQLFIGDKTEDLSKNRAFFESFDPEWDYLVNDIVAEIKSTEVSGKSISRSFYLVFKLENEEEYTPIYNTIFKKGYRIAHVQKQELVLLMKNYILREFNAFDIMVFEEEQGEIFDALKKKKQTRTEYTDSALTKRLTPVSLKFEPTYMRHSDMFRKVIMVKNIPTKDILGYLKPLAQMKNTTFSMHITPMDKYNIATLVNQQANHKKIFNKNKVTESIQSKNELENITEFYQKITKDKHKVFLTSIYVEVYAKTLEELRDNLKLVTAYFSAYGITYDALYDLQKEAFLSVLPLGKDYFKPVANNLPSPTLSSMYPFSYSDKIDENGFILGETIDGGNMFIDFWARNKSVSNGNICIFGTSGFGKTYIQKKILSQSIMAGISTFTLDPENEYEALYRKMRGTVINCIDDRARINIFEVRQLQGNEDEEVDTEFKLEAFCNDQTTYFQHLSWLKDFFSVLFPKITPQELSALMLYVAGAYEGVGMSKDTDFKGKKREEYPTFTELYLEIETDIKKKKEVYEMIPEKISNSLLLLLRDCYDGSLSYIMNGHTNIADNTHICFSIRDLLSGSTDRTQAVLFNILTYIWNKITQKTSRILFNVDELHVFFEENNLIVGRYIKNFTKRVRKYNSHIMTATQNFSDMDVAEIRHITMGIFNNASHKFIFYPGDKDVDLAGDMLKLPEGEMQFIKRKESQHCIVKTGQETYYMKVGTLPFEQEIFGLRE